MNRAVWVLSCYITLVTSVDPTVTFATTQVDVSEQNMFGFTVTANTKTPGKVSQTYGQAVFSGAKNGKQISQTLELRLCAQLAFTSAYKWECEVYLSANYLNGTRLQLVSLSYRDDVGPHIFTELATPEITLLQSNPSCLCMFGTCSVTNNCGTCHPHHYGSLCGSTCVCKYGTCNGGVDGDGTCDGACDDGHWGALCDQDCGCDGTQICDRYEGCKCASDAERGYFTNSDITPCSICQEGYWGTKCDQVCCPFVGDMGCNKTLQHLPPKDTDALDNDQDKDDADPKEGATTNEGEAQSGDSTKNNRSLRIRVDHRSQSYYVHATHAAYQQATTTRHHHHKKTKTSVQKTLPIRNQLPFGCNCNNNDKTGHWTGLRCNYCLPGYYGSDCKLGLQQGGSAPLVVYSRILAANFLQENFTAALTDAVVPLQEIGTELKIWDVHDISNPFMDIEDDTQEAAMSEYDYDDDTNTTQIHQKLEIQQKVPSQAPSAPAKSKNYVSIIVFQLPADRINDTFTLTVVALNSDEIRDQFRLVGLVQLGVMCNLNNGSVCSGYPCEWSSGVCVCSTIHSEENTNTTNCSHLVDTDTSNNWVRPITVTNAAYYIFAVCLACMWTLGTICAMVLWCVYAKKHREQFHYLTPFHRVSPFLIITKAVGYAYAMLCICLMAFSASTRWSIALSMSEYMRYAFWVILRFCNVGGGMYIVICAYGIIVVSLIVSAYLNWRLWFLVSLNLSAWHHTLDSPKTRQYASSFRSYDRPRHKPPAYTRHWILAVGDTLYTGLSPLVFSMLLQTFNCIENPDDESIEPETVLYADWTVQCWKNKHLVISIISMILLLMYYTSFILNSFVYVAGTQRLQARNLDLGLSSIIAEKRPAFFLYTQAFLFLAGTEAFIGGKPLLVFQPYLCIIVLILLLAFHIKFQPCNYMLMNAARIALTTFAIWTHVCSAASLFFAKGSHAAIYTLLIGYATLVVGGLGFVYYMWHTRLRVRNTELPAWMAKQQEHLKKIQDKVLEDWNKALQLAEEDLQEQLGGLRTPRSVLGGAYPVEKVVNDAETAQCKYQAAATGGYTSTTTPPHPPHDATAHNDIHSTNKHTFEEEGGEVPYKEDAAQPFPAYVPTMSSQTPLLGQTDKNNSTSEIHIQLETDDSKSQPSTAPTSYILNPSPNQPLLSGGGVGESCIGAQLQRKVEKTLTSY